MADFGGVLKNQSIGVASADGKAYIHTAGKVHDASQLWGNLPRQDDFLESMATAIVILPILSSRTWAFSPAPTLWLSTKLASTSCSITRLSQAINLKQYDQRFARCDKPIVKVGVNFDAKKGNIEDWSIE